MESVLTTNLRSSYCLLLSKSFNELIKDYLVISYILCLKKKGTDNTAMLLSCILNVRVLTHLLSAVAKFQTGTLI